MSHYGLKAIRLDASRQRVTHVLWQPLGGLGPLHDAPTEASVVNALRSGDHVSLLREISPGGFSIGPAFRVVVYPDGVAGIKIDGFSTAAIPTI